MAPVVVPAFWHCCVDGDSPWHTVHSVSLMVVTVRTLGLRTQVYFQCWPGFSVSTRRALQALMVGPHSESSVSGSGVQALVRSNLGAARPWGSVSAWWSL